jgi:5-methylcytosine-specific restriction enzyme subunit McrC
VRYNRFSPDRPENRLNNSTVDFLLRRTTDFRNETLASRLLPMFDEVEFSTNHESDFARCVTDRSVSHYELALAWCRVFLRQSSFTPFQGSENALSLLFPMEKVFESYIAAVFRRSVGNEVRVLTQDSRFSLFDKPQPAFRLRPDIVLEAQGRTIVLDTKWKLLSDDSANGGVSQSDMYQMYAYAKKYGADRVLLLYPNISDASPKILSFRSDDMVCVDVATVDLVDADGSVTSILDQLQLPAAVVRAA